MTSPSPQPAGRTVHLVEAASPQTCGTMLALLAMVREQAARASEVSRVGRRSQVVLLGGQALGALAATAGVDDAVRVGVPYGRALGGLPAVRRALRAIGPVRRIVCWSAGTLAAARLLCPGSQRTLVVTQPMTAESARLVRWCHRWPGRGTTQVVTLGATLPAVMPGDPHHAAPLTSEPRGILRKRWGLPDERVKVVALLSDPPTAADAQTAALAVALARTALVDTGWRGEVALLIHPDQRRRLRVQRMLAALDGAFPLVLEAGLGTPWRVMAGCDAGLAMGEAGGGSGSGGRGGLSVAVAMAAGVPVVAGAHPGAAEGAWLEHGRTGLLAVDAQAKSLAYQLTTLLREPDMAGRLGLAARHTAARHEAQTGALRSWTQALEDCPPSSPNAPGLPIRKAEHAAAQVRVTGCA